MNNKPPDFFQTDDASSSPDEELDILRREVSLYRALLQAAPEGVAIVDSQIRRFRYVNDAFCNMLGYSKEELLTMGMDDIHPAEDLPEVLEKFSEQAAGERLLAAGIPCKRRDGTVFLADINTTSGLFDGNHCCIGFFEDVTERVEMEKALRESENRFRDLASLLPSIVFECDSSGLVTFASQFAYKQLGYSPEDMKNGLNVLDCIAPEDRVRAKHNIQRILQGENFGANEYVGIAKDGFRFPVLVYSSVIVKDKKNVGLRGIIIDISERKKLEEGLVRSQKLESLGVLAGGIAHDFNNMLVGVLGNISLARNEVHLDSPSRVFLRQAEFAADKAKGLTHQLLTFSKGGAPIIESVDMAVLIHNAAEFALRGSRVAGKFQLAPDLWYGEVDSNQISQVIQNLVINAIQAMPDGGELLVSGINYDIEDRDSLPVSQGKYVKITIADQGPGLLEGIRDKIFDPYFTTKEGNSGLGLAVVHSIILRHRGTITVESNPTGGATFVVYLPAVLSELINGEKTAPQHHEPCKVLVMDDDDIVLQVASAMLKKLGYEVGVAINGHEALAGCREAKESGRPYDVVIFDLTIPGGDGGVEVLKQLRAFDSTIKAIVSSGYSNDPVMADYNKYGFQGVVPKPYQMDGLDYTIKKVLAAQIQS